MMKKTNLFRVSKKQIRMATVLMMLLSITITYAQSGGAIGSAGLTSAANTIKGYWGPIRGILQAIGAVVGLIGAIRIYNKWVNGDQDINKEIVGWGGACLFLVIAPTFIAAFFGITA